MKAMYEVEVKRFFKDGVTHLSHHEITAESYSDCYYQICHFYSFPIVVGAESKGEFSRNGLVKVHILSIKQSSGFKYDNDINYHTYSSILNLK